jgi:hypothetical protein
MHAAVGAGSAWLRLLIWAWGHALSRWGSFLLAEPAFAILDVRPLIPGGRCSQGGVKLPTGGKGEKPKPASAFFFRKFLPEFLEEEGSADSV